MKTKIAIILLVLLPIVVYFLPDQFKYKHVITFNKAPEIDNLKAAGEITKKFKFIQPISISDDIIKIANSKKNNSDLCLKLFMANYNNRSNSGTFKVSFSNSKKTVSKIVKASSIKDNAWKNICFKDFKLNELTHSPSTITIKGINSPAGHAVTVWLSNNHLLYNLAYEDVDNEKFISLEKNIVLLVVFLATILVLLNQKKSQLSSKQIFTLSYMGLFILFLISGYIYYFHLLEASLSFFDFIIFFKQILLEYIAVTFLILLLLNRRKFLNIIVYIVILVFITIYFSQYVSLAISNDYITKLALQNVEFIGLLLSWENILTLFESIVILLFFPLVISLYITKKLTNRFISSKQITSLLLIAFISIYFLPMNKHIESFNNKIHLQYASPIQAFYALFTTHTYQQKSFDTNDIKILKQLGFTYNPASKCPLLKQQIYKKNKSFFKNNKPKNVIVIFTEGFSARTSGVYNKKFNGLTPNLKKLADNNETMLVANYYNHTAATYRGLHGQLCSLYPKLGGGDGWEKKPDGIPPIHYKCLPDIFNNNGYDTIYLNIHYKNSTGNDELASGIGFKQVMSGEELSLRYLKGIHKLRENELTDHQSYKVLTNYLKSHEHQSKPFFLAMYTVETHAWLNVGKDGIKYKDGSDNTLNTIHNMDDAFGKFWKYFQNSVYADNTVVIFTSDHCHYYDKSYLKLMKRSHEDDYQKYFVDRIPLLIYAPNGNLPKNFDAKNTTSVSLAPTIVQIMGFANEPTAFMGQSLFERTTDQGIASIGDSTFLIHGKIYILNTVPSVDKPLLNLVDRYINTVHTLEMNNKLIPENLK